MDIQAQIALSLTIYKLASIAAGTGFAYMGYRLFMAGVWGQAGDLDAQFANNRIVVKQAAPGTFFALFGTIVVGMTLWKGLELSSQSSSTQTTPSAIIHQTQDQVRLPDEPPF